MIFFRKIALLRSKKAKGVRNGEGSASGRICRDKKKGWKRQGADMNTGKQLERQIRDLQKELLDAKKEADLLRLQPCTGDFELRKKDEAMSEIETRVETINQNIRELEKKRREMMSTAMKNSVYESPFN
jgi:chromosome segregation ATPase